MMQSGSIFLSIIVRYFILEIVFNKRIVNLDIQWEEHVSSKNVICAGVALNGVWY
jgi:hypothetical protein